MPLELDKAEMPYFLSYLWQWFVEISGSRGYSEFGPMPITYQEIKAWADLTQTSPSAWEINTLKQLDQAYLAEAIKKK